MHRCEAITPVLSFPSSLPVVLDWLEKCHMVSVLIREQKGHGVEKCSDS